MSDQADGLRLLASQQVPATKKVRVISIISGKGGVGKSNIAVNLGIALSDFQKKVVVIDADLGLANINILVGVIPKYNLFNVINDDVRLEDVIIEIPEGIGIIAGASGFTQLTNLGSEQRKEFLRKLKGLDNFDYVIIDASPGVSQNVLSFIGASDDSLIITTPEPTSITDAYGIIKAISFSDNKPNLHLIVNRVSNIINGKKVADRIINISNQFLSLDIQSMGYILEDPVVQKSVFKQEPFFRKFPSSKASICITNIACILDKRTIKRKRRGIAGFLNKLIK